MADTEFKESKNFITNALDESGTKFSFRIDNPQVVSVILNLKDSYETNAIGEKIYYVQSVIVEGNNIKEVLFKDRMTIDKTFLKEYLQPILQVPKEYIKLVGTRLEDNAVLVKEE